MAQMFLALVGRRSMDHVCWNHSCFETAAMNNSISRGGLRVQGFGFRVQGENARSTQGGVNGLRSSVNTLALQAANHKGLGYG